MKKLESIRAEPRYLATTEAPDPKTSEQDYVRHEVEVTRRGVEGKARKIDDSVSLEDRLQRTEQYARWRWREFGSVNSQGRRSVAYL